MEHLTYELEAIADGISSLVAMASSAAPKHAAVMADVQQALDWAWHHFPDRHGPIDDGMDWDHDLQVVVEAGGWHTVTLTLTGTDRFIEAFLSAFGISAD